MEPENEDEEETQQLVILQLRTLCEDKRLFIDADNVHYRLLVPLVKDAELVYKLLDYAREHERIMTTYKMPFNALVNLFCEYEFERL